MKHWHRLVVLTVVFSLLISSAAFAALDKPAISTGASGHTKQVLFITAGPSGAPNGFTVRWMDASTYFSNGASFTADPSAGDKASFTGEPTLNTFGGQYTTFKIGPNETIRVEIGDLLLHGLDAAVPQIAGIAREVAAGLREQRRDGAQLRGEFSLTLRVERKLVLPHFDGRVIRRPLMRGRVALRSPDRHVVRRVAHPRLQHAHVEVEAVHLGAHDLIVNLLRNGPRAGLDCGQACLPGGLVVLR
jgi:hypothetical protein